MQIVSGRLRLVIYVLLHLIGNAAGFAGLLRGCRTFTCVVERTKMHCGVQLSDRSQLNKHMNTNSKEFTYERRMLCKQVVEDLVPGSPSFSKLRRMRKPHFGRRDRTSRRVQSQLATNPFFC